MTSGAGVGSGPPVDPSRAFCVAICDAIRTGPFEVDMGARATRPDGGRVGRWFGAMPFVDNRSALVRSTIDRDALSGVASGGGRRWISSLATFATLDGDFTAAMGRVSVREPTDRVGDLGSAARHGAPPRATQTAAQMASTTCFAELPGPIAALAQITCVTTPRCPSRVQRRSVDSLLMASDSLRFALLASPHGDATVATHNRYFRPSSLAQSVNLVEALRSAESRWRFGTHA